MIGVEDEQELKRTLQHLQLVLRDERREGLGVGSVDDRNLTTGRNPDRIGCADSAAAVDERISV